MKTRKWWRLGVAGLAVAFALTAIPTALGAQTPATIEVGSNSELGDILVAGENGLTLYIFTPDEPGVSNCNGGCAVAWPPLTVPDGETPTLGAGVSGEVSLITRDDGTQQVALNGQALYFYQDDSVAGEANGQAVNDVWWVLDPAGAQIGGPTPELIDETPTVELGGNDTLGEFLVAANGLTLYIFTPDEPGVSNCNGGCAVAWPPLTVEEGAMPVAGAGVNGELSLITRDDGTQQVALDGAALYFYQDDAAPGEANGQDVNDVWFVIDANGNIVNTPATPAPADPPASDPPGAGSAGNLGLGAGNGTSTLAVVLLLAAALGLTFGGRALVQRR